MLQIYNTYNNLLPTRGPQAATCGDITLAANVPFELYLRDIIDTGIDFVQCVYVANPGTAPLVILCRLTNQSITVPSGKAGYYNLFARDNIVLLTSADATINLSLISTPIAPYITDYPVVSTSIYGGAVAMFSSRIPAGMTYTGPLMRVARSSDGAELDIGVGEDSWLNTITLNTFVGANSATVVTWYDITSNGNHLTSIVGTPPGIVTAGAINTLNGRPTVNFVGTGSLVGAGPVGALQGYSVLATRTDVTQMEYGAGPGSVMSIRINNPPATRRVGLPGVNNNFDDIPNFGILRQYTDNATSMRLNGVNATIGAASNSGGPVNLEIGGRDGALLFNGSMSELVLFPSERDSATRGAIELDQMTVYSL